MTHDDKERRHCIPCRTYGDHTSLDHRHCPSKRRIVQERLKIARETRKKGDEENKRDTELIKKTMEISGIEAWPALQTYQHQQQQTTTIILLALLDENCNQGTFQTKLDSELTRNGLPLVKYNLAPNTAETITNIICGANSAQHTLDINQAAQALYSTAPINRAPPQDNPRNINTIKSRPKKIISSRK